MLSKNHKILLICPFYPFLTPGRPLPDYQPHYHWYRALQQLKHQVTVFPLKAGQSKLFNMIKLKKTLNNLKPGFIFFSAGIDRLSPIQQTVFFSGVPPMTLSVSERRIARSAKLIVVNDPDHQKKWQYLTSAPVVNLPISAIDPAFFKPAKIKKIYPFSFVGTLFESRQPALAEIVKQGVELHIWGWIPPSTDLLPELKSHYHGPAWNEKVVQIYQQSTIALNLVPDHMVDGGNLRTFEIPACQTLEFVDKINPDYYQPGQEVVVFNSPGDLKTKLKYYLSHPENLNSMAQKAYQSTLKNHTFTSRFKKLMNYLSV